MNQLQTLLEEAKVADLRTFHLIGSGNNLFPDTVYFRSCPDMLVLVELGRVRRKKKQSEFAAEFLDELADFYGLMRRMAGNDQEHRLFNALPQMTQIRPMQFTNMMPSGASRE